jgi:trigger factor
MKYEIKEISKTKKMVEIEVAADIFDKYYEKALLNISKDAELPGFRKGKVPQNIVEEKVNSEGVASEAAEIAIQESWMEFLRESKEEVISQPQIEVIKVAKGNPFVFTAEFEVLPIVELPEIKSIEIKKEEIKVEDKEVQDALNWLQQSRAIFSEKEDESKKEDLVEFSFSCPSIENDPEKKDRIVLGKGHYIEGLEDVVTGMKKGEEKEFETSDPRNKNEKVKIKIKLDSVKKMDLPEINDEWVKGLGKFNNVEELKEDIKKGITEEKKIAEDQRRREDAIKKILEKTKFETPQTLVKREVGYMLGNIKERVPEELKISFEEYLKQIKKTEEEVSKELEKSAEEKVRGFLVLHQLIKDEKIEASEVEVNKKIEEMLSQYPNKEEVRKEMDAEKIKLYIEDEIKREKAFKLLGC